MIEGKLKQALNKHFIMLSSKLCITAKWITIALSSLILTACTNSTQDSPPPLKKATLVSPNQPKPLEKSAREPRPLKVSIDPNVQLYKDGGKKGFQIKLRVQGDGARHIEGYKFTDVSFSNNGKEFKVNQQAFILKPYYQSPIRGEERKKWFKPANRHVKKLVQNVFYVPTKYSKIDETVNTVDLRGNLSLIVATEENKCLCRVKDFLAEGKLTEKPFEFNGGTISFKKEPSYKVVEEDRLNILHDVEFLFEDSKNLLFEIYFEDGNGKEVRRNAVGTAPQEENMYIYHSGFNKMKPDKDWTMVIVYGHENCRKNVPFHFKNVDISFKK